MLEAKQRNREYTYIRHTIQSTGSRERLRDPTPPPASEYQYMIMKHTKLVLLIVLQLFTSFVDRTGDHWLGFEANSMHCIRMSHIHVNLSDVVT